MFRIPVFILLLVLLAGCGGRGGFDIIDSRKVKKDTVGFLDPDTLQVVGIGYPSPLQNDPAARKSESLQAAIINARMLVINFFMGQLEEAKDEENYKALAMRIGNFSVHRYDPIYGQELLKGGSMVDAFFDMLAIRGYVHEQTYDEKTHKSWVAYRVVQAGLLGRAKQGFVR